MPRVGAQAQRGRPAETCPHCVSGQRFWAPVQLLWGQVNNPPHSIIETYLLRPQTPIRSRRSTLLVPWISCRTCGPHLYRVWMTLPPPNPPSIRPYKKNLSKI